MSNGKIKIIKSTKNIFDSAKDTTISKVIELSNSGVIKIEKQELVKLVQTIKSTFDDSFQRSVKFHEKEISNVLDRSDEQSKKK